MALGYRISHPDLADGRWGERLNGDAPVHGGAGVGHPDPLPASGGSLGVVLPANGDGESVQLPGGVKAGRSPR
jgi:hypothetical protein